MDVTSGLLCGLPLTHRLHPYQHRMCTQTTRRIAHRCPTATPILSPRTARVTATRHAARTLAGGSSPAAWPLRIWGPPRCLPTKASPTTTAPTATVTTGACFLLHATHSSLAPTRFQHHTPRAARHPSLHTILSSHPVPVPAPRTPQAPATTRMSPPQPQSAQAPTSTRSVAGRSTRPRPSCPWMNHATVCG